MKHREHIIGKNECLKMQNINEANKEGQHKWHNVISSWVTRLNNIRI